MEIVGEIPLAESDLPLIRVQFRFVSPQWRRPRGPRSTGTSATVRRATRPIRYTFTFIPASTR